MKIAALKKAEEAEIKEENDQIQALS
jgi:hypothetical protein